MREIKLDTKLLIEKIKEYFREECKICIGKAFYEMKGDAYSTFKYNLYKSGVEPFYSPNFGNVNDENRIGKSVSDSIMICSALETLYKNSNIDTYVIVSSDKDFVPLIKNINAEGKEVLVIGLKLNTSDYLIEVCNSIGIKFFDYEIFTSENKEDILK